MTVLSERREALLDKREESKSTQLRTDVWFCNSNLHGLMNLHKISRRCLERLDMLHIATGVTTLTRVTIATGYHFNWGYYYQSGYDYDVGCDCHRATTANRAMPAMHRGERAECAAVLCSHVRWSHGGDETLTRAVDAGGGEGDEVCDVRLVSSPVLDGPLARRSAQLDGGGEPQLEPLVQTG